MLAAAVGMAKKYVGALEWVSYAKCGEHTRSFNPADDLSASVPEHDRHGVEMYRHFEFAPAAKVPRMETARGIMPGVFQQHQN